MDIRGVVCVMVGDAFGVLALDWVGVVARKELMVSSPPCANVGDGGTGRGVADT